MNSVLNKSKMQVFLLSCLFKAKCGEISPQFDLEAKCPGYEVEFMHDT